MHYSILLYIVYSRIQTITNNNLQLIFNTMAYKMCMITSVINKTNAFLTGFEHATKMWVECFSHKAIEHLCHYESYIITKPAKILCLLLYLLCQNTEQLFKTGTKV